MKTIFTKYFYTKHLQIEITFNIKMLTLIPCIIIDFESGILFILGNILIIITKQ